ncbi:hypothetical protein [Nocardia donostiensis]|nr:hypothetical protein [Nocardia donostiensis]
MDTLQQALADLGTAYRNFFVSIAGKRKRRGATRCGFGPAG